MTGFLKLIRDDLQHFTAYSSARLEAKAARICLNANESPWDNHTGLNRYPEQQPLELMQALSDYYELNHDQLLATRGSDEGIDLLMRLFCQAGQDAIAFCPPTFGMYEVAARLQGASVVKVPLLPDDFSLDSEALLAQDYSQIKLVFLCSPNNPTGNVIDPEVVLSLANRLSGKALVVVDEAYIEFCAANSVVKWINQYDNLVVLRTFSKAFGLAAARVGSLLANSALITCLRKILPPYPLPLASIQAVITVLQQASRQKIQQQVDCLIAERESLLSALQTLAITERVWPSSSNFIFVKFTKPVLDDCAKRGIILREMQTRTGIKNAVRITVGSAAENRELLNVLSEL